MKTFLFAMMAAILVASQLMFPVAASSTPAALASGSCGDIYTVTYQDTLAKIATACDTTVANILTLNPQVTDFNVIYVGQMLRLSSSVPLTSLTGSTTTYTNTGYARVGLSATRVVPGESLVVYVTGFPANSEIDYRVGVRGSDASVVYDGTVSSTGAATQTVTIPSDADVGEYWTVQVVTTSLANIVKVTSASIYIGTSSSTTTNTGYARVSLSAARATVGGQLTVSVGGFPANSEIDYRVGQNGEPFSVAYDGTVSSAGTASQVITIPSDANVGEYWTVQVITTSQASIVKVTSALIYIGTASTSTSSGTAKVSLSATQADEGDTVVVYVSGFPVNSEIDYRVGKLGQDFSVAYDGTVGSDGKAQQTITIPAAANSGEYWVVRVVTTSLANITSVTSHTIYIP